MTPEQIAQFGKGAQHTPDPRDYRYNASAAVPFDWNIRIRFAIYSAGIGVAAMALLQVLLGFLQKRF